MINIDLEFFEVDEFTVDITVPRYWNDLAYWNDGEPMPDTTSIKGIFDAPYSRLNLGEAGQDSFAPQVKFPSALSPPRPGGRI